MVKELKRKYIKTSMLVVTILLAVFLVSVNILNYSLSERDTRSSLDQIVTQNLRAMPGAAGGNPDLSGPEPEMDRAGKVRTTPGRYFVARVNEAGAITFSDLTHDPDMSYEEMVSLINKANVEFAPVATGETETESFLESPDAAPLSEGESGPGNALSSGAAGNPDAGPTSGGENGSANLPQPGSDENTGNAPRQGSDDNAGAVPPPDPGTDPGDGIRPEIREERGKVDGYLYYATLQMDGSVSYAFLDVSRETDAMLRIMLITVLLGAALWCLILIIVIFLSKKAIAPIAENIEKQRLFITNAGHEFKTPLAVIISNVDVQELHGGKTKWLENIRTQALRLSDLTKQMLTLAKMEESGTSAFTSTTFDASQVLEETIRIFRESAAIRGIRIQTDVEAGVEMHFPKDQYRQLLELLLDNAVKYGKENGFLSAALHADRKMVHLTFRNDCEELPDADPDRLFDRFYRPDSSRNRSTGGSGIGLAVVRAIAQQGGGSAQAHFLENQVIEFVIELPRRM